MDSPASNKTTARRRVLFFAEAVTLAHVARPLALASALDASHFDVLLAVDRRYEKLLAGESIRRAPIRSIPSQQFLQSLAKGRPLYDAATLAGYVREDLDVIRRFDPDLVVGDLRLSLSISARLAGKPYASICNAYWSPLARQRYVIPEHALTRLLGVAAAQVLFKAVRRLVFALHCRPINSVRRACALPSLGFDLRRVYTDADYVLYADSPELAPTVGLPANHRYLGPVQWSPPLACPPWWDRLPADRPIVYVTMGSSGCRGVLSEVLSALADAPVTVIAAGAGKVESFNPPANTYLADYLPGQQAAARASLVICNGGSPTTYQALALGKPVLGIAANLDQHLNMAGVVRRSAGILLRAGKVSRQAVGAAVEAMLNDCRYTTAAGELARRLSAYHAPSRFRSFVEELLVKPMATSADSPDGRPAQSPAATSAA